MKRNLRILLATAIAILIVVGVYLVWNNSRIVTGNVVPHLKTQIAYMVQDFGGGGDVYILDTSTGTATQLTIDRNFDGFSWSPDGKTLNLTRSRRKPDVNTAEFTNEYFTLDVSTAELKSVPPPAVTPDALVSPDGKQIAYSASYWVNPIDSSKDSVFVKDIDKLDARKIASGTAPAWSPDGTQIAFAGQDASDTDSEIYLVNTDGTNQRRLLQNPGIDSFPSWSFDGQHVAFVTLIFGGDGGCCVRVRTLSITDIHGKAPVHIADLWSLGRPPAWSPTANQIAFTRDTGDQACVVNADGSNLQCNVGVNPVWSSDGTQVVYETGSSGRGLCVFTLQPPTTSCFKQAVGSLLQWRP